MQYKDIHIIKGKKPILISAPHTRPIVKTYKNSLYRKPAEKRVKELVELICQKTDTWGIFTKGEGVVHNWQQELHSNYQNQIKNIIDSDDIILFIEIHGSHSSRPFILDYDFLIPQAHPHDNIVENIILKTVTHHFPKKQISKGFFRTLNGPGKETFTYFVRKNFTIPAVQFELNKKSRQDDKEFRALVSIFKKIINTYHDEYRSSKVRG